MFEKLSVYIAMSITGMAYMIAIPLSITAEVIKQVKSKFE